MSAGGFKQTIRRTWEAVIARRPRRLRLRETLSLGGERFLAVVALDQQEFLVGGAGNSIALLARLPAEVLPTNPAEMSMQVRTQST